MDVLVQEKRDDGLDQADSPFLFHVGPQQLNVAHPHGKGVYVSLISQFRIHREIVSAQISGYPVV